MKIPLEKERYWFFLKTLLFMKLLIFIFCFTVAQANTLVHGQNINIAVKNESMELILLKISKQAKYDLVYDSKMLKRAGAIDVELKDASLENALKQVLNNQPFDYEIKNNTIVIKPRSLSNRRNNVSSSSVIQQRQVTGKVTDENGDSLLGVTVAVKGSPQIGTTTDGNGVYALLNLPENATLTFRYVGYLEQEIAVGNQSSIDVSLVLDQTGLDEVVIVGFGEQKKESVVASVATIKGEKLKMPTRSLSNNLAGQLPGLIAVQRSGEPGYDNSEFWIRGVSSFAGGTSPLVLVDGVPREMNDIEPDEIETFTLLKDAAATSVYGSEGANGVVLITSKRGRAQKTAISYRGEISRLTPTRSPRFANSYDYTALYNEMLENDGRAPNFSDDQLALYKSGEDTDLYPSTDWYNALMRDHTSNTRHTLSFRGGGDRMKYFVSGAYFGESGLYKVHDKYNNNADLNRYNLRSNVDIDITNNTLLSIDLSGQYLQANRPRVETDDLFKSFYSTPPHMIPAVYSNGLSAQVGGEEASPYLLLVERGYRKEWRSGIQSKVGLEQKLNFITQGLKARAAISYDANSIYHMTRSQVGEGFFATGREADGELIFEQTVNASPLSSPSTSSTGNKNIYIESTLNYNRAFDKHTVGAMFLYYQKERQLHNDALAYRKQAWVGRGTYAYDDRYMIEGNFSFTGSEQFADGYRYGFFPAIGLAWNVMNEHFIPDHIKSTVSALKLRASIGRTGNDQTGAARFLYRSTFGTGEGYNLGIGSTGPLNGVGTSLVEGRFESPSLSWEIEMKRNYGFDLSLFNGKIDIQADYFDNERADILLQRRTVSAVAGFNQNPWQNFGKVSNKGVDGSLNVRHRVGQVDFALLGNFTFARNKVLEYDEIPQVYPWMAVTGTRLNALTGMVAERLFGEDDFHINIDPSGKKSYTLKEGLAPYELHAKPQPGDIKYVDQNGDGKVTSAFDAIRDVKHPTVPEIIYGFGLNVAYKGIYVNTFFQGAGNVSLTFASSVSGKNVFYPFHEGLTRSSVRQEVIESRWTEDNPSQNVFYPRITEVGKANSHNSTWWMRDASFLRLKNLEVGYNFPKELSSKLKMNLARIYIMGQNVALWDKVKISDPELGTSGGGASYPLPSIWTMGLEVSF